MTLTAEQITAITCGAVEMTAEKGSFTFRRFYPEQIEAFRGLNEDYAPRAYATTGIRLEFHSDSRTIRVDAKYAGSYEILVDGLSALHQACQSGDVMYLELDEGDKYITVMLPWHKEGGLTRVMLDDGSYVKPHAFARKFLFLGDSITQGCASTYDSAAHVAQVARWFDADYLNWGVGGTKFFPETLKKPDFQPDAVFVAYGTNDYATIPSMEAFEKSCKGFLDTVKEWYPGIPVFVVTPLWRLDGNMIQHAGALADVRQKIIEIAQAHGFIHIDGYKMVPHDMRYMADKRLHPNDLGFCVFAQNLIKTITPYL